ncbi:hypothetical protein LSPH26S_03366 [Lysinibacillus sphaericus]
MLDASFISVAGRPLSCVLLAPIVATASLRPKLASVPELTAENVFHLLVFVLCK